MEANEFFHDKNFVVTGKLENFTKDSANAFIQSKGSRTSSSVTRSTHVLVVGDKPGSKLAKAQQNGTQIITEAELLEYANS